MRIFTPEHKRKLSEAQKKNPQRYWLGKKRYTETIIKMVEGRKGYKHSEIVKKKMSKSREGHVVSEETRKKIGKGNAISLKGMKLSQESIAKRTLKQSGMLHWNWKGGITPEDVRIRNSTELRLWREAVFARDNWTCQKYGIRGVYLHAHHVQNFADFPELRTSIENGVTLSDRAHREFHKKYGRENNTRDQLEEFLADKEMNQYDKFAPSYV